MSLEHAAEFYLLEHPQYIAACCGTREIRPSGMKRGLALIIAALVTDLMPPPDCYMCTKRLSSVKIKKYEIKNIYRIGVSQKSEPNLSGRSM